MSKCEHSKLDLGSIEAILVHHFSQFESFPSIFEFVKLTITTTF